ncbi:MmgE/PrpD family protein [Desertibaculum subflavum]|uniref:MmgE/PrpD family protein n=1 Tax=Desertibaculum subflavum TaxID=2268458 RepID=UPI0013C3FD78
MGDASAELAAFAVALAWDEVPETARAAARTFVLDSLGVALAGAALPATRAMAAAAGKGEAAAIWGAGRRADPAGAAMVNAIALHGQEFDCIHEGAVVHPMAVVLPVALATAETLGKVSGRRLMEAVVAGVEVALAIGVAARQGLRFFRPATAGAFGASAAAAKLRGFDAERTQQALGLAYAQLCGTMQAHTEGSAALPAQVGFNARNAVTACDLAAAGLQGLAHSLEGPFGYFHLFEAEGDIRAVLPSLGRSWRMAEVSHKPFPTGRAAHGGLDGLDRLRREHGFVPADVAAMRLKAPPLIGHLVGRRPSPGMSPAYARLCLAYAAAVALLRGRVWLDDFTPERIADAEVQALAARIAVVDDGNPDPNALTPQRLEVDLTDGRRLAVDLPQVLGSPAAPLGRERHLAKFRACWNHARPGRAADGEALIALVDRVAELEDLRPLFALLA